MTRAFLSLCRRYRGDHRTSCLLALVALALGCATDSNPDRRIAERVALAEAGLDTPEMRAGTAAVEAALQREKTSPVLDELELRVGGGGDEDDDHSLRIRGRLHIANPLVTSATRDERRAETEIAIAKLEQTALEQRSDRCVQAVDSEAGEVNAGLYREYAKQQEQLLEWNSQLKDLGAVDALKATEFELERRLKLAEWSQETAYRDLSAAPGLPAVHPADGRLVRNMDVVHRLVKAHHPSIAVHRATAERFRRHSIRERREGTPSLRFVEVGYEPINTSDGGRGYGAQLAVSIPFGRQARASAARSDALLQGSLNSGLGEAYLRSEEAAEALAEIEHFESQTGQWRMLTALAREVEDAAQIRLAQRQFRPPEVASLIDQAFEAHGAVLSARKQAGLARCLLLATTGIPLEDWPRE